MNKGEIWCLNKIKSGLLVMTDNLTIKVQHETNGKIYTKIPDQHPLSGRHRFRFGSGRWTVYRNRLVWMIIHKELIHPEFVVDHKDGNRLNDQPDNLQLMPKYESHQQGNSIQTSDVFDSLCRWFDFVGMYGREPVTEEETLFVEIGF